MKSWSILVSRWSPHSAPLLCEILTGKQVDKADAHIDSATVRISLQPLPPGIYTVKWRAVTVDTHHTEGTFTFTVGDAAK